MSLVKHLFDKEATKSIAIIGGGPGGLTLARLLQLRGGNVKVYERDVNRDARDEGATLDLHKNSGLKALNEAGLMDAFKANYRPGAEKLRFCNKDAKILMDDHNPRIKSLDVQRPEIDRGPLKRLLLESLEPNTVVWDSQCTGLLKDGSGWVIQFKNGTSAIADIVVGADGANSKIRPYVTEIKRIYSSITLIEGNVYDATSNSPKISELLKGGKIFAFGGGQTFIVSSKGDGSYQFYMSFKEREEWCKECGIDWTNKAQVSIYICNFSFRCLNGLKLNIPTGRLSGKKLLKMFRILHRVHYI